MLIFVLFIVPLLMCLFFFFFNDTATTEIYTLSLHDALPISGSTSRVRSRPALSSEMRALSMSNPTTDRKSTRLNSSHSQISYAVFCLKKKKHTHFVIYILDILVGPNHVHLWTAVVRDAHLHH